MGISATLNSNKSGLSQKLELNLRNENTGKEEQIQLKDAALVKSGLIKCDMSYVRELDSFVQADNGIYPVKACLTDSSFTLFSDISIIKGCFINEAASEKGLNCAVISESLAQKLFGTHDVLGNKFELFNEKYKIIGLYRGKKSIISFFSSDGAERVYIPFKSHAAFKDIIPKTIFIRCKEFETKAFREEYVKSLFKTDERVYKINDYYNKSDLLTTLQSLFIFIIGLLAIMIIVRRLIKFYRSGFEHIKGCLEKAYIKEMLKNEKFFIIRYLLCSLGSIALIAIIFISIRFKVNIPVKYIPYDNILDWGFYMEKLEALIYDANSSAGYTPSYHEACLGSALILKSILLALSVVSFIFVITHLKILNITKPRGKDLVYIFTLPVTTTLILSLLFSAAAGTAFCLPVKETGVIYIYLLVRVFLSYRQKRSI